MATIPAPKLHSYDMNTTYTFSSQPRALLVQRRKLRDYSKADRDERSQRQINGSNPRIRLERGKSVPWTAWTSTVSTTSDGYEPPLDTETPPPPPPPPPHLNAPTTRLTLLRAKEHLRRSRTASSSNSIAPVAGRKHLEVQTQLYLEELKNTTEESDATCQTEELLERPALVTFVVAKTGVDAATQIEQDELFDFDMESRPVLEVLIGKAVQHAVVEVLQEEDLANIRKQQRRFQQLRKAYLAGEQWFKEQEEKMFVNGKLNKANGTLDANEFDMLHSLHSWSFISDPIEKELERAFLPWVLNEVEDELVSRSRPESAKNGNSGLMTRRPSDD